MANLFVTMFVLSILTGPFGSAQNELEQPMVRKDYFIEVPAGSFRQTYVCPNFDLDYMQKTGRVLFNPMTSKCVYVAGDSVPVFLRDDLVQRRELVKLNNQECEGIPCEVTIFGYFSVDDRLVDVETIIIQKDIYMVNKNKQKKLTSGKVKKSKKNLKYSNESSVKESQTLSEENGVCEIKKDSLNQAFGIEMNVEGKDKKSLENETEKKIDVSNNLETVKIKNDDDSDIVRVSDENKKLFKELIGEENITKVMCLQYMMNNLTFEDLVTFNYVYAQTWLNPALEFAYKYSVNLIVEMSDFIKKYVKRVVPRISIYVDWSMLLVEKIFVLTIKFSVVLIRLGFKITKYIYRYLVYLYEKAIEEDKIVD